MFVVVSTVEDNGEILVQAVSTSFFVDGVYYYPKNDVLKAIKERRTPNDSDFYAIKKFAIVSKPFG